MKIDIDNTLKKYFQSEDESISLTNVSFEDITNGKFFFEIVSRYARSTKKVKKEIIILCRDAHLELDTQVRALKSHIDNSDNNDVYRYNMTNCYRNIVDVYCVDSSLFAIYHLLQDIDNRFIMKRGDING